MMERYKYEYHGWQIIVYMNGDIKISRNGEDRTYGIGVIAKIEQNKEYVYLYYPEGNFVQVKFEQADFLVIDEFNSDGEFVDSIGSHVFELDLDMSF